MMDMNSIIFGNIELKDIANQLGSERNFRFGVERSMKVKQTRMSDFILYYILMCDKTKMK